MCRVASPHCLDVDVSLASHGGNLHRKHLLRSVRVRGKEPSWQSVRKLGIGPLQQIARGKRKRSLQMPWLARLSFPITLIRLSGQSRNHRENTAQRKGPVLSQFSGTRLCISPRQLRREVSLPSKRTRSLQKWQGILLSLPHART